MDGDWRTRLTQPLIVVRRTIEEFTGMWGVASHSSVTRYVWSLTAVPPTFDEQVIEARREELA